MTALSILENLGACRGSGDAIPWVRERAPRAGLGRAAERLWRDCERGDWLIWLVSHDSIWPHLPDSDRRRRLIACDCAERVLSLYESSYPTDSRPRVAIETARRYADGQVTSKELRGAGVDAYAAWRAAKAAAPTAQTTTWATWAAGWAAEWAAWAAWAAAQAAKAVVSSPAWGAECAVSYAARSTASDEASDAAWAAELRAQADIVRSYYSWREVRSAIEAGVLL